MLRIYEELPEGLLQAHPAGLKSLLQGPALIHLPGEQRRPVFVSILLHGNETTGLSAIQTLLSRYRDRPLPRALSVLIGNVEAARVGRRLLPGQRDYNRIWISGHGAEQQMAQQVLSAMRARGLFASIDIHNNTGRNPYYAIIAEADHRHLRCAALFSDTVVFATYPDTTCTVAFSRLCPAVTLEAGLPGEPEGLRQTVAFLEACMRLKDFDIPVSNSLNLFHTVAVVKVRPDCSYGFTGEDVDLQLVDDIDQFNFRELHPGSSLGKVRRHDPPCLHVLHISEREAYADYFYVDQGELKIARPVMPAMLTTNRDIITLDCLCYLMERLPISSLHAELAR